MRRVLAILLALALYSPARAQDEEEATPISRTLAGLKLGQPIAAVRKIYPPTQAWPSAISRRRAVTRYRVRHGTAKSLPDSIDLLYLGFDGRERLVEIEVVYVAGNARARSVEKMASDYQLVYGAPRRLDDRFWWEDRDTVLRVFAAQVPIAGVRMVSWRTAVQIFDRGLANDPP